MKADSHSVAPERSGSAFICGDLRIDVGRQVVTQAGRDIVLPKLSFDVLLALVRNAPNVLSTESLIERAWDGTVVSPETVVQRIKLLRDALGDDSREPRYVGAMRSRGYFFIPQVMDDIADASASPVPLPPVPAAPPAPVAAPIAESRILWAGILSAALLGLIAWWFVASRHSGREQTATEPSAAAALSNTAARTVAVMPFQNLSSNPANAFLGTGLPEMILNRLSHIRNLSVVARSSSFSLDPKIGDVHEIGRRLHSGHLIEGTVQRDGDRIRILAQLIDTASGNLVWSEGFDRRMDDVFAVQDDIADRIAAALAERVAGLDLTPTPPARSADVAANLSYLNGVSLLKHYTVGESEAAVPFFEKAIALDPTFVAAYAALYDAHMQTTDRRREDMATARVRWKPLIDKALELDPKSGAARFARAMWGDGTPSERDADFKLGLAYDPSNGRAITEYAEFLNQHEHTYEEVDAMLRRALWVDPLSPRALFKRIMFTPDVPTAVRERQILQVLEIDPNFHLALQRYGNYRWFFHGLLAEAIGIEERAIAIDPQNPWSRHTAMAIYLDLGDEAAARNVSAGTASSEQTSQLLLAMYRGDWRRAGLEAYSGPGWTYGVLQNFGAGEAVRDYALRTGEIDRAVRFLELKYWLHPSPQMSLELGNYRQAEMLAELFDAEGRKTESAQLRAAATAYNDTYEPIDGPLYAKRLRARLWLSAGQRDAALQELAESFRAGDYVQWWYTLERDPAWKPLHEDPRFRAIAANVRAYVAKQRGAVDDLRRRGEIPDRGSGSSAKP